MTADGRQFLFLLHSCLAAAFPDCQPSLTTQTGGGTDWKAVVRVAQEAGHSQYGKRS